MEQHSHVCRIKMININIKTEIGEFQCELDSVKKELTPISPIENWEVEENSVIQVLQPQLLRRRERILIMLGSFFVAPLRIVASDLGEDWSNGIIPYRISGEFKVEHSTDCEFNIKPGYGYGKPTVEIIGEGIRDVEVRCVPSPDILKREMIFANWRLISVGIWALLLFGALLGIAIVKSMPVIVVLMGLLILGAIIILGWRITRNNAICRKAMAEL